MDLQKENIKTRLQIFSKGCAKPSMTVYEHGQLKATLSTANSKLKIGDIVPTDQGDYKVSDVLLQVEQEEVPKPDSGIELSLVGTRLAYNFEVQIILEKV